MLMDTAIFLTRMIVPILTFLGLISNLFNIILLTRPKLIQYSCSLYFLAMAATNLFYCCFLLPFNLLADGYQLDATQHSTFLCKFISYLLNLCPNLSIYFLVLASIDRFLASSVNAQRRQWSSVRSARWAIFILIVVLMIFFLGAFIAFDISRDVPSQCVAQSESLFNRLFIISDVVLYAILGPFALILFGFLTIYNIKRVHLIPSRLTRRRRTEGQLSRMLLLQVGTNLLLALPFCVIFCMLIFSNPSQITLIWLSVYIICKLPFYLTTTSGFFLYILSAQIYRNEFFRLYSKLFNYCRHRNIVVPMEQT